MEKGNVLVLGNSGVGKSTLINAVLGEEKAKTGWGTSGTTKELEIYESEQVPFRLIDTIGFEPSYRKERQAIKAVRKWSKERAKDNASDNDINVIWYCVEGTTGKLFPKTISSLIKATSIWKSVPIIVVITKSYSVPDRKKNIDLVREVFASQKHQKNIKDIIPVVAQTFTLNDNAFAAPEGITDLIDATNLALPEGIRASAEDVAAFKLNRKRAFAQATVGTSTTAAVVVGAVPIPIADALILSPLETAEVSAIARVYGVKKNDETKNVLNTIIEMGTVGAAAKMAIGAIKAIPGIHIATSLLNAVIAGSIVATLGEGSIYIFEQIYLGKKSPDDLDWVKKIMESKFSNEFVKRVQDILANTSDNQDLKTMALEIIKAFSLIRKVPVK